MAERVADKVYTNDRGEHYIIKPFISPEEISERVKELGKEISRDYAGRDLTIVASLKGASVFLADLIRAIDHDCLQIEFVEAQSYGDGTSPSDLKITHGFDGAKLNHRNILIVDDIYDTGQTLAGLIEAAQNDPNLEFSSLRVATLLSKPSRHKFDVHLDYVGFVIEDNFVAGYGLDYLQHHRQLPGIGIVEFVN